MNHLWFEGQVLHREDVIRNQVLPIVFLVVVYVVVYKAWMSPFASTDTERLMNTLKILGLIVFVFGGPLILHRIFPDRFDHVEVREKNEDEREGHQNGGLWRWGVRVLFVLGLAMLVGGLLMVLFGFPVAVLGPSVTYELLMGVGLIVVVLIVPTIVSQFMRDDVESEALASDGWLRTEEVWVHPWVDHYLRRLREKQKQAKQ